MLLPTKGVSSDRALITIGSEILEDLQGAMSVSTLWEKYSSRKAQSSARSRVTFDWYSLALATLYALRLIEMTDDGHVRRSRVY